MGPTARVAVSSDFLSAFAGLPDDLLPIVRMVCGEDDLDALQHTLPAEALKDCSWWRPAIQ